MAAVSFALFYGEKACDLLTYSYSAAFCSGFSILLEAVALALTWRRTAGIRITLRKMKMKMGITELLWRDGALSSNCLCCMTLTALGLTGTIHFMYVCTVVVPAGEVLIARLAGRCLS